jgi:oligopeptidase A
MMMTRRSLVRHLVMAGRAANMGGRALTPRYLAASAAVVASTTAAATAHCLSSAEGKTLNPLLTPPAWALFPRYADIRAEHVAPAMTERLTQADAALIQLEATIESKLAAGKTPTYKELNDEAERIQELVNAPWSAVNHLKSVKDEEALRKAVQDTQPKVVQFFTRMSQSEAIYRFVSR